MATLFAWIFLILLIVSISSFIPRSRIYLAKRGFRYKRLRYGGAIGAVLALILVGVFNLPSPPLEAGSAPVASGPAPDAPPSDLAPASAPAVAGPPSINALDLTRDYDANEVAADNEYKGKTIEVYGFVDRIGKDITSTMYVTLQNQGDDSFTEAQLFFPDSAEHALASLVRGQQLAATCECGGKMMNVILTKCQIVPQ